MKLRNCFLIAGTLHNERNDETEPVAVRVASNAVSDKRMGEQLPLVALGQLKEGDDIAVSGKKNKLGVIRAAHVVI